MLPAVTFAQTRKDYEHAIATFQSYYNNDQGDKINDMFSHMWDKIKAKRPFVDK